jgi:hypothetical protein
MFYHFNTHVAAGFQKDDKKFVERRKKLIAIQKTLHSISTHAIDGQGKHDDWRRVNEPEDFVIGKESTKIFIGKEVSIQSSSSSRNETKDTNCFPVGIQSTDATEDGSIDAVSVSSGSTERCPTQALSSPIKEINIVQQSKNTKLQPLLYDYDNDSDDQSDCDYNRSDEPESYNGDYNIKGHRTGKGSYCFANGDTYIGDFKCNHMDGYGKYYYSNGCYFEGSFSEGHRVGKGKFYRIDGTLDIFYFHKNVRLGTGLRWTVTKKSEEESGISKIISQISKTGDVVQSNIPCKLAIMLESEREALYAEIVNIQMQKTDNLYHEENFHVI